jgi:polyisoprenoid-binding protein YceI
MKVMIAACALVVLAACSKPAEAPPVAAAEKSAAAPKPASAAGLPAGEYKLDKTHASLHFRVNHLGFSNYTARFNEFDATLQLDPANPAAASLTATVNPASLDTDSPLKTFNAQVSGEEFLDAAKFPQITYKSTRVEMTGPDTARVTGDLTFHGVTKPVTLLAKFNGGYASMPMDPSGSRIGFSATGTLNRSEFGVGYGVPAPGTTMGVSDAVEIIIEAEFSRPLNG